MEWSRAAQHYDAPNWLQWQWALQRAHLATLVLPPPPPPPLAESSSLSSDTERESLHCDASGNEDGLRTPAPLSPRSVSSHSKESATERRLESLRVRLQRSSLFASARQRQQDKFLAARLRSVIDLVDDGSEQAPAASSSDGGITQLERRATNGFATLSQVAAAMCPRPSRKAVIKEEVKIELETTASVATRGRRPGRRPRGRKRGGRNHHRVRKAFPMKMLKEKIIIPKWRKGMNLPAVKGKCKGKGKGKQCQILGKSNGMCSTTAMRRAALPLPTARPMQQQQVTVSWVPRPSRKARPSQAASVTVTIG